MFLKLKANTSINTQATLCSDNFMLKHLKAENPKWFNKLCILQIWSLRVDLTIRFQGKGQLEQSCLLNIPIWIVTKNLLSPWQSKNSCGWERKVWIQRHSVAGVVFSLSTCFLHWHSNYKEVPATPMDIFKSVTTEKKIIHVTG